MGFQYVLYVISMIFFFVAVGGLTEQEPSPTAAICGSIFFLAAVIISGLDYETKRIVNRLDRLIEGSSMGSNPIIPIKPASTGHAGGVRGGTETSAPDAGPRT